MNLRVIYFAFLAAITSLLVACGGGGNSPATPVTTPNGDGVSTSVSASNPNAATSTFATVDTVNSAIASQRFIAIRDDAAWTTFWNEHKAGVPLSTKPTIDFNSQMVVGVILGTRTGCYSVTIRSVYNVNPTFINWHENVPTSGATCPQSGPSPAHLIAVPKNATVQFNQVFD
ncbi:MAG: hypothetical protein HYX47_05905 [Burkholderiales bacterium]|nr:hypothetical protein [Burkholderiales bacterium]